MLAQLDLSWIILFDYIGTAVFAISGALAAGRKQMDVFGVVVLAMVTAVGGGTIRDMMLDAGPVFWLSEPLYLWIVLIAALATILIEKTTKLSSYRWLEFFDAAGLAVFTIIGVVKAQRFGLSYEISIIFGVMTGTFGGLIRDVIANDVPHLLRREIYATASLAGGASLLTLVYGFGFDALWSIMISMVLVFALRMSALYWKLSLPVFDYRGR